MNIPLYPIFAKGREIYNNRGACKDVPKSEIFWMNNKTIITIAGFKLWDKAAISMDKTTFFFAEFAWKKRVQLPAAGNAVYLIDQNGRRDVSWKSAIKYASSLAELGTLRSADGDGNENVKKAIGLMAKRTILHVHHAFCTFLSRPCRTTTLKCLISRLTEEVHKRRRNFLSRSKLGYGSYEFSFRRVHLHLTKLLIWSNRDEDWKNANSLFQRRFRCRRHPRILRSLLLLSVWEKCLLPILRTASQLLCQNFAHTK